MFKSINDLIRTDRPESPTDLIFLVGSLVLMALLIYATQTGKVIPGFEAYLVALGSYKTIKAVGDYKKATVNTPVKEAINANPATP